MTDTGNFQLDSVEQLPNATVSFPGEVWTNGKASEAITPGEAIFPVASGGSLYWRVAEASDDPERVSIAFNVVQPTDSNVSTGDGPNELVNTVIPYGAWVRAYKSGAFWLTLITPAAYVPGELVGWDVDGVRPTGKTGTGAWAKDASADVDGVFEVTEFRPVAGNGLTGVLGVKFAKRNQF